MLRKTRARLGLVALTVASGGHTALNALLASCASCIVHRHGQHRQWPWRGMRGLAGAESESCLIAQSVFGVERRSLTSRFVYVKKIYTCV